MSAPTSPVDVGHPESHCSAAIKPPRAFASQKLLRCSAPGLRAMPGLSRQRKLSNLVPTLQPKQAKLTSLVVGGNAGGQEGRAAGPWLCSQDYYMIAGVEGCEEDTGLRALTTTHSNERGHLITPAEFQNSHSWSAAWTITGWFAACTVTDPAQRKPDNSKSDAGGP